MALTINKVARIFSIENDGKAIKLPDPNPNLSAEEVRKFYSGQYPEITNASIDGPTIIDDEAHYEFSPTLGTKG